MWSTKTKKQPASASDRPVLIRRHLQWAIGSAFVGLCLTCALLLLLGFLVTAHWVGAAIVVAPAAYLGYAFWGVVHVGIWVDNDGLTMRQIFWTRRIRWTDVDRISPAGEDWQKYVGVVLKDGRRIRCAALGAGRIERASRLDPYVQQLQALKEEASRQPLDRLTSATADTMCRNDQHSSQGQCSASTYRAAACH
jgi:hypothetical protein